MWKIHGLKKLPKISFCETKQIIPDKNLFGKSNFATNAFDVLIQLTNRNYNGSNSPQTAQSQARQVRNNEYKPKGDSENNGGHGNVMMEQSTNGAIDQVNVNQLIEDVCPPSNDSNKNSDSDSNHDNNNPRETNEPDTYGKSRRNTNVMKEGTHHNMDKYRTLQAVSISPTAFMKDSLVVGNECDDNIYIHDDKNTLRKYTNSYPEGHN